MVKTVIATAILGLGIAGAYFVVQTSNPTQQIQTSQGNNLVPANPFVEEVKSAPKTTEFSQENMTDKFVAKIGEDIKNGNPGIKTSADGKKIISVPNAEALTDELLSSAIDSFDINKLYPPVSESELNIQKGGDKNAVTKYINDLDKILAQENNLPASGQINSEEEFLKSISAGLPIYEKIYSDLIKLPVPERFQTYHKKEIELVGGKINILKALSTISKDPVTAIIVATYSGDIDSQLESNYLNIKSLAK